VTGFDPRQAAAFRYVGVERVAVDGGLDVLLHYAFEAADGARLASFHERLHFPAAPAVAPEREAALASALDLLHLIAGVSYYKAGVPAELRVAAPLSPARAALLTAVYTHGLAEFAHQNGLDLRERIRFPVADGAPAAAPALGLKAHALVAIGGGKDSLVSIEALKAHGLAQTVVWVGSSALIADCAAATGQPTLNLTRQLAPALFEWNQAGALNGHIPVTAINSAIFAVAALLYDADLVVFSNEASADTPTLEAAQGAVNHQWSKGLAFERPFAALLKAEVAADLGYCSLLRSHTELAVTRRFAALKGYDDRFSSCNRNFRIRAPRPESRWCGQCPKCHFVFLALAPFMPKPRLLAIFGRNLLDDPELAEGFDALIEWDGRHRPFECVGEALESRAALAALAERADWAEDALVARFRREIQPGLGELPTLEALCAPRPAPELPERLRGVLDAS
jgi:hypothetical protein